MFDINQLAGIYMADIETTGLLPQLKEQGSEARLHNLCAYSISSKKTWVFHGTDRETIQKFLDRHIILVMHNGLSYDKKALEFFGYDVSKVMFVDSLPISWYLDRTRKRHGLEQYGEEFGVPKPEIKDWKDLTQEDYDHRVQEDVKIQTQLYFKLKDRFSQLYGSMDDKTFCNHRVIRYLMFKTRQLADQADNTIKIDREAAEKLLEDLTLEIDSKFEVLMQVMPKVAKKAVRSKPKVMFKKNREPSALALKWFELLKEHKLPENFEGDVEVIVSYEEPNPASPQQVKDWLFSLGWVPLTFEFKKEEGESKPRSIPQVYIKGSGGDLCPSILHLAEEVPEVEHLVGLGVLKHRKGVVKGFIERMDADGVDYVVATAGGFTNTLRLRHKAPVVNLPSIKASKGKEIRGMLIAKEGKMFCGADLSALENILKFNFQYPYDPEFVESQMRKDFDPHLEIAFIGGLVTRDEINFWKIYKEGFHVDDYELTPELDRMLNLPDEKKKDLKAKIEKERAKGKSTNYGCLPMDTKVLTQEGFKLFHDLSIGDTIISYRDGILVEDKIEDLIFHKDAIIQHYGDSKKVFRATHDHRWLTTTRNVSEIEYKTFKDFNTETKIIATAPYDGGSADITPNEAALMGWILSDGSFGSSVTISQSRNKFWREIEELHTRLGLEVNKYVSKRENGNDVYIYTLPKKYIRDMFESVNLRLTKKQSFESFILSLDRGSLESFLQAFWLADGNTKSTKSYTIKQNVGDVLDAVMLAMYLIGDGRVSIDPSGDKCKTIRKHQTKHFTCQRKSILKEEIGDVFCLTTGNGNFIVKQGNEIFLTGNCQYGAGGATIARTAKIELELGKALVTSYKKLNWSIEKIAKDQRTIKTDFDTYQLNPLNGIWYSLKVAKDAFSTLIQGSGSYILDLWLLNVYKHLDNGTFGVTHADVKLLATFHDEMILEFDKEFKENVRELVSTSLEDINKVMMGSGRITIPFGCDIQFGERYSNIH